MTPKPDVEAMCKTRRRFGSREAAAKNLPRPYRAYLCPRCRGWHVAGGPVRPISTTERTV